MYVLDDVPSLGVSPIKELYLRRPTLLLLTYYRCIKRERMTVESKSGVTVVGVGFYNPYLADLHHKTSVPPLRHRGHWYLCILLLIKSVYFTKRVGKI